MEKLRQIGRSTVMAFSLFTRIPMPQIAWDKANMRYMMCMFPLVGVVIGALLCAWGALCATLGLNELLLGAGVALIPVAVTGGIHLDGFCDVCDALSSHAGPERKMQIMKDPHIGSFAATSLACLMLANWALGSGVELEGWRDYLLLGLVPVLSRCASGIATLAFPSASAKGMQETFRDAAADRVPLVALACLTVGACAAACVANPATGLAMAAACSALLAFTRDRSLREFGGFNGDQAGHLLQCGETALLACIVAAQALQGVLA